MLNDQIIGGTAVQRVLEVVQPFVGIVCIHGIQNSDLIVQNDVGIIGHAVGNNILTLKQIHLVIVDSNVFDII